MRGWMNSFTCQLHRPGVIRLVIHLVIHHYLRHEAHRAVVSRPRTGLMREADAKESKTFVVEPEA